MNEHNSQIANAHKLGALDVIPFSFACKFSSDDSCKARDEQNSKRNNYVIGSASDNADDNESQ